MAPLRVKRVLADAAADLKERWRALFQALILPAAGLGALALIGKSTEAVLWGFIPDMAIYAVFSVTCHRIILIGESSLPNAWGLYFTWREVRYAGWGLVMLLASAPFAVPLWIFFLMVGPEKVVDLAWPLRQLGWLTFGLPMAYVAARVSLALPATAIDERPTWAETLDLSQGNGGALTTALAIPPLAVGLVWWVVGVPRVIENPIDELAVRTVVMLLGAVEISVLSVAFRTLAGPVSAQLSTEPG